MPAREFHGKVGFVILEETTPDSGDFEPRTYEKPYYGSIKWYNQKFESGSTMNGDIRINNQIEIVANKFAFEHFAFIKYVVWNGIKWHVSNVEVGTSRLILTIGGVYNVRTS